MLVTALAVLGQQAFPLPHDPVWTTGREVLKEVSIPRGVVNGYRSVQWIYVVNEPLPNATERVKEKLPFKDRATEIGDSALLRRGFAFAERSLGDVVQKVSMTKGNYTIKRRVTGDTSTVTNDDPGYTVITITENVAPGKVPSKDWPAATRQKYAMPPLPVSLAAHFKGAPHSWIGYLTVNTNKSQFVAVFRDPRSMDEIVAGLDGSLVAGGAWTKSLPNPAVRLIPVAEDGIDFVEVAPAGSVLKDACAISVVWVAESSKTGWAMPGYEYLYRKIE